MRTTSDIDGNLLRKTEERACKTQRILTGIIEDSLRQTLTGAPPGAAPAHTFALRPVKGTLFPGVDVSDRGSLYERMEGPS